MRLRDTLWVLFAFMSIYSFAQRAISKEINFHKADSIALANAGLTLDNLPFLSHRLTTGLDTDLLKLRAIYIWVCINIKNDHSLFLKNKRKRKRYKDNKTRLEQWNSSFRHIVFKTLVKRKKTLCTGYSYIIKVLSKLAGIDCEIIQGYGKTSTSKINENSEPNHSWNAVKLNKRWYLLDATWASGILTSTLDRINTTIYNDYFLTEPSLFAINHYPLEQKWLLLNNTDYTYHQFLSTPLFYTATYAFLNKHVSPKSFKNTSIKNEVVHFEYKVKSQVKPTDIALLIDDGKTLKRVIPYSVSILDGLLSLEHKFHSSGYFDVHLMIDSNVVASYRFKVEASQP